MPFRPSAARHSPAARWALLLAVSTLCVAVLELVRLPAALLLGPMAAAIGLALVGGYVRIPAGPYVFAQGILGLLIARALPPAALAEVLRDWPVFLAGVVSVVGIAASLGWLLARWRVLPGSTAVWGSAPGAAMVMTLMAEAYGADIRLVAFMQYLRIVCVALVASLVAGGFGTAPHQTVAALVWFPELDPVPFLETVALAGVGAFASLRLRIPAGPLMVPLVLGAVLQGTGLMTIELPPWLLAASYAFIGWSIGLRFDRPILAYAARAFPRVLASILVLIATCGLLAAGLVAVAGVDPLSAYLATSPGGADSIAIIAATSRADVAFVMAMQTSRFLVVVFAGPSLARFVAARIEARG